MKLSKEQLQGMIDSAVAKVTPSMEVFQQMIDSSIKAATTVSGRKDLAGKHGDETVDGALVAAKWFRGLYNRAHGKAIADDIAYTGADGQGGYLVPEDIMAQIARLLPQKSLVAQKATFFPQEAPTVNLPTLVSGLAVKVAAAISNYCRKLGELLETYVEMIRQSAAKLLVHREKVQRLAERLSPLNNRQERPTPFGVMI